MPYVSYAKIWTNLLSKDWFLELPATGRAIYLQLILYAKQQGDTGMVTFRHMAHMGHATGTDARTCRKYVAFLQQQSRILMENYTGKRGELVTITIPNYQYFQGLRASRGAKKPVENYINQMENSATNKTRQYNTRRDDTTANDSLVDSFKDFIQNNTKWVEDFLRQPHWCEISDPNEEQAKWLTTHFIHGDCTIRLMTHEDKEREWVGDPPNWKAWIGNRAKFKLADVRKGGPLPSCMRGMSYKEEQEHFTAKPMRVDENGNEVSWSLEEDG